MTTPVTPIAQVTNRATRILVQELGVVDTIRFLNQFRTGDGDYTTQRLQRFQGQTVASIVDEIKACRSDG